MSEHHYERGCDFCEIARVSSSDTEIVWQSEDWMAFFPLNPATPGHTLIIPKTHVRDLWDVEPPLDQQLIHAVIQVGRAVRAAMKPEGLNLITSSGRSAEQTVFHLHLHIVPRWEDDGFDDIWPQSTTYENADLTVDAEQIHRAMEKLEAHHG